MTELPIIDIHEAGNVRASYDAGKMAELVESVRAHGVLQPLLVRVRPQQVGEGYELVCGHRRLRAARTAGLFDVPVAVREMTDREVLEAQLAENLQRADIHPMDEADGYRRLLELGLTVEVIAQKVGRSRSSVYARLKLLDLVGEAREALLAGKLDASVALPIARIPVPRLQEEAARSIMAAYGGRGLSAREARDHITERFMRRLKQAQFSRTDSELVPAAGACRECPKKTGNNLDLFGDVENQDLCVDPDCFRSKEEAHWGKAVATAKANDQRILSAAEGAKAFYPGGELAADSGFIDLDARQFSTDANSKKWRDALKAIEHDIVIARDREGKVRELVARGDAVKVLKEAGHDAAKPVENELKLKERSKEEKQKAKAAEQAMKLGRRKALEQIANKAATAEPFDEKQLRLLARQLVRFSGFDGARLVCDRRGLLADTKLDPFELLERIVKRAVDIELRGLIFEMLAAADAMWPGDLGEARDTAFGDIAKLYGVNVAKLEAAAVKELEREAADAKAAKKGARG